MPPITTADTNRDAASDAASNTANILKERRFKLSRACDRCRRRRIKCDEGHPCQACLTASSACTFEEPGKRTHAHKSKRTATLEDRMHHLETLIQAIPATIFATGNQALGVNGTSVANGATVTALPSLALPPSTTNGTVYPIGVPPPSLNMFPLTNPSTHFRQTPGPSSAHPFNNNDVLDTLTDRNPSVPDSYLYFDDEGYTRWQGETSGLALLDLLVDQHYQPANLEDSPKTCRSDSSTLTPSDWFPDRVSRRTDVNPETLWRLVTAQIVPELMDSLVQCYLSTSYYILPFLHIPTFLADYGNPQKWGEPGFAAFIVAICCLASRHINDPRVRADPGDGVSSGTQWFELLHRLRTLPIADRPTLYTIQADLIAAVYAVGLGKLSKAAALFSEAITTAIDAGLHRSAETYDLFDPIEEEVRKRTFWCVYLWDKQLCAHFGRPPMIRIRDCDVEEPAGVDDEFITKDGIGTPPRGTECRMGAFVRSIRMLVVLESILDQPVVRQPDSTSFMARASSLFGKKRYGDFRDEESLLDEIHRSIPAHWAHTPETLASDDTIRVTQATRLHCQENFVRLLLYRGRFARLYSERTSSSEELPQSEAEIEALKSACSCALAIVSAHLQIATKGLMTYYGVHVIHQLTQAGRTLVTILLNCQSDILQRQLLNPALEALRSCVGLLRRFSGRYVCGMRSGDVMEEFCRLTGIPLELGQKKDASPIDAQNRPPWIRPVRRKSSMTKVRSGSISTTDSGHRNRYSPFETFHPPPPPPTLPTPPAPSFSEASFMAGITGAVGVDSAWDLLRTDSSMYLSEEEMMAMFNNANMDMTSFLHPTDTSTPSTHSQQHPSPLSSVGFVSGGSPFHAVSGLPAS